MRKEVQRKIQGLRIRGPCKKTKRLPSSILRFYQPHIYSTLHRKVPSTVLGTQRQDPVVQALTVQGAKLRNKQTFLPLPLPRPLFHSKCSVSYATTSPLAYEGD